MKIYIETNLTRIPECCDECPYMGVAEVPLPLPVCSVKGSQISEGLWSLIEDEKKRPEWCPLEEISL